jgi:hypothetical protein
MRIVILAVIILGCTSHAVAQEATSQYPALSWMANGAPAGNNPELANYAWESQTRIGNFSFSHVSMLPSQGTALSADGVFYKLSFVSVGQQSGQFWSFKRTESSDRIARAELTDAPLVGEGLGFVFDSISVEYRQGACMTRGCRQASLSAETKPIKWQVFGLRSGLRAELTAESYFERSGRGNGMFIHAKFFLP